MKLDIETEQEQDGRWIAAVIDVQNFSFVQRLAQILLLAIPVLLMSIPAVSLWIWFSHGQTIDVLGLGPTELTIIMVLGILLFGRTLRQMGQYFGKRIIRPKGQ